MDAEHPTRDIYIWAIVAGFALSTPLVFVNWFDVGVKAIGLIAFYIVPFLCLLFATYIRWSAIRSANLLAGDSAGSDSPLAGVSRRSLFIAAPICLVAPPLVLGGIAMLFAWGGNPLDFWPMTFLPAFLGLIVSLPLSVAIFLAGLLP